jgi:hypothetical protein
MFGAMAWKSGGRKKDKGTACSGGEGLVEGFWREGSLMRLGFEESLVFDSFWGEV